MLSSEKLVICMVHSINNHNYILCLVLDCKSYNLIGICLQDNNHKIVFSQCIIYQIPKKSCFGEFSKYVLISHSVFSSWTLRDWWWVSGMEVVARSQGKDLGFGRRIDSILLWNHHDSTACKFWKGLCYIRRNLCRIINNLGLLDRQEKARPIRDYWFSSSFDWCCCNVLLSKINFLQSYILKQKNHLY